MRRYVIRRLGLAVLTLAGIIVVVFIVTHILPGNPALVQAGGIAEAVSDQQPLSMSTVLRGA